MLKSYNNACNLINSEDKKRIQKINSSVSSLEGLCRTIHMPEEMEAQLKEVICERNYKGYEDFFGFDPKCDNGPIEEEIQRYTAMLSAVAFCGRSISRNLANHYIQTIKENNGHNLYVKFDYKEMIHLSWENNIWIIRNFSPDIVSESDDDPILDLIYDALNL